MKWASFFRALRSYLTLAGYADFYRTDCNKQEHSFNHYVFNPSTNDYDVTTLETW